MNLELMKKALLYLSIVVVTIIFNCSCNKKDKYEICNFSSNGMNIIEYKEVMLNWLDCLIIENLKEKNKNQLIENIKGDFITSAFTGIEGKLSETFLDYKSLLKIITEDELVQLTNSEDSGLRFCGFKGLAELKSEQTFETLKNVISDTTKFTKISGCVIYDSTIGDACIELVTKKYSKYTDKNEDFTFYQLTESEKKEIDQLILKLNLDLEYKRKLLLNNRKK